jgi:hypothetical protein
MVRDTPLMPFFAKMKSPNQMHRTATSRCGFVSEGYIEHWIGSQSPLPVAVGNLGRYTEKARHPVCDR